LNTPTSVSPDQRTTHPPTYILLLSLLSTLAAIPTWAEGPDTVVYKNNFDMKPGSSFPGWSSSRITFSSRFQPPGNGFLRAPKVSNVESPNGRRRFLGDFGGPRIDPTARTRVQQTIKLSLDKLASHSEMTVAFDLLILRSWDGNSPQYGPDRWRLSVADGPTLLDATFSNNPKLETDKSFQDYPRPHSRPHTAATAVDSLGYDFFGDSTYHFEFTFPHEKNAVVLEFSSDLFEGKGAGDEGWGLDNVRVVVRSQSTTGKKSFR
jgi:hypothetical protein